MSVNDEAEHPWLAAEKALIAEAVRGGVPFWGSCLGVQLLASALGAEVRPGLSARGGRPARSRDGRGGGRSRLLGARLAARRRCSGTRTPSTSRRAPSSSPPRPRIRTRRSGSGALAYGVQFHLELDEAMADEWAACPPTSPRPIACSGLVGSTGCSATSAP